MRTRRIQRWIPTAALPAPQSVHPSLHPPSDDVVAASSGSLPAIAETSNDEVATNVRPATDEMAVRAYVIMKGQRTEEESFVRVFDIRSARDQPVPTVWANIVMFQKWGVRNVPKTYF